MANFGHLRILNKGVREWNYWRQRNPSVEPDLSRLDLSFRDLRNANFSKTNFIYTKFSETKLSGANFYNATFGWTIFADVDLSKAEGLGEATHLGPSALSLDTIYLSNGKLPENFLFGCGATDNFLTYLPSLISSESAMRFYSCFISYSFKDEEFAKRLYSRMRDMNIRVWFAAEDVRGGEKIQEQIENAIVYHDKLLIILSENSLRSEWVITEIRNARKSEVGSRRRKLFPIRLVDIDTIKKWKCFDADIGKDLAVEVREYFIPDFSNWKDHDAFEYTFSKLLRDLRSSTTASGP